MNEQTIEKMKELKFWGMLHAFKTSIETEQMNQLTTDEMVAFLIDSEWEDRHNRKIDRLIKEAHFRYKANIEQIDFYAERNLDKNQLMRFAECTFIDKHENILVTGSTGVGYVKQMIM